MVAVHYVGDDTVTSTEARANGGFTRSLLVKELSSAESIHRGPDDIATTRITSMRSQPSIQSSWVSGHTLEM